MSVTRKIVVLGTGGTIAGTGNDDGRALGYQAGQIGVAQLLQGAGALATAQGLQVVTEQVAQLDSKDMGVAVWQALAQACQRWLAQDEVAALVITHGTDTLEETAWLLQSALQPGKPVVLTCAMRPATALSADGPANLRDALCAAAQLPAGVWVVAAGEVHAARWVRKVHPYRLNAFAGVGAGPQGWVEEGVLRLHTGLDTATALVGAPLCAAAWAVPAVQWPWVEVVTSCAAARAQSVDALVAAGVQGLVVAATGNGSVHSALAQGLERARQAGVAVVCTTRCEQGQIVLAPAAPQGEVSSLSPVKARIELMLQLLRAQVQAA